MEWNDVYMYRCLQLAQKGAGLTAPNPMVGALLVYQDQIIGEGFHEKYGGPHAEVNCFASVLPLHRQYINKSTLYVSLEPCAHFGKTPPCSDLIIKHKIRKVVIGCRDPFVEVNGKGIEKLKAAGVETVVDVLKEECMEQNKRFFTFHLQHRPYIILKWAQTGDGKIGTAPLNPPPTGGGTLTSAHQRLLISNELTNRLVHKWRSEEASILVGTNTALLDDPQLTNRYWPGKQPVRLVLDKELKLPSSLQLFSDAAKTIVFNYIKESTERNIQYYIINKEGNAVEQMVDALYQLNIQSVLVEGGAQLLQGFIDAGLWDEARVIENSSLKIEKGLNAPQIKNVLLQKNETIETDTISYYTKQ